MNYDLPTSVTIDGKEYEIRADFRPTLDICVGLNDPDADNEAKALIALKIFYPDYPDIPNTKEALEKCLWFLRGGKEEPKSGGPVLYNWEQDFDLIIAAINKVAGFDIRTVKYNYETNTGGYHWFSFLTCFQEIGDCTFAQVVNIRNKLRKGKKLEKYEREWYERNRDIVDLKTAYSEDEEAEFEKWSGRPVKT